MPKQLYDTRNYPIRTGVSQAMRYSRVLNGENVKIDERTLADFLLFAQRLSKYLQFYNLQNEREGNWEKFLPGDISFQLAKAAADKSSAWSEVWNELMEPVEDNKDETWQQYFTWRFDFLYSLLQGIVHYYMGSFAMVNWQQDLGALVNSSQLNVIYYLLKQYHVASASLLLNNNKIFTFRDSSLVKTNAAIQQLNGYDENAKAILLPEPSLFANADFIFGTAATTQEKIAAASEYLDELALQLVNIYSGINQLAANYLEESLTSYNEHQPHVGLFYTFLRLSQQHQSGINGLLLQHLDFYYRDVLRVKEKGWKTPKAYVHFELAKNIAQYFLPQGTKLDAGKDDAGKNVVFITREDILVNKASISSVKSFTHIKNNGNQQNIRITQGLFASGSANTSDGNGKPLRPGASWKPFSSEYFTPGLENGLGLSFYSPLLAQEQEGEKLFTLQVKLSGITVNASVIQFIQQNMSLVLITDKGPLYKDMTSTVIDGNGFKFSFTLVEETIINKQAPNASMIVGHKSNAGNNNFVSLFQTASIVSLILGFEHQSLEVINVETTAGLLQVSGAFPAFGGLPKPGSSFYVISPILLNRKADVLEVEIEWGSPTERPFSMDASYGPPLNSLIKANLGIADEAATSLLTLASPGQPLSFTNTDRIKFKLDTDLGHKGFARDYTESVLERFEKFNTAEEDLFAEEIESQFDKKQGIKEAGPSKRRPVKKPLPQSPFTPMIKSIRLHLKVSEEYSAGSGAIKLYAQYPFGYKPLLNSANFLPATPNEGELYIGISALEPEQSLNILVQVEEGSADASLDDPSLQWHYLKDNEWQLFDESKISDNTRGLMQSGIVSFIWLDADCTKNTLLPAGKCWIRASIPFNQSNAVCNIVGLHTQAVPVMFQNNNNNPAWLGTNLPAGSITKLLPRQAVIKSVTQPYPTFGGQKTETAPALYTRTSERLRHKSRAVTVWDFERMILEEFPDVYKVKALNHACFSTNDKVVASQGHVLILVVAKTAAQNSIYKPLVSKSKLSAIYNFIIAHSSPFAKIKVMNPVFEPVTINTQVVFMPFVTDRIFYENRLLDDVNRFLSPWAFNNEAETVFGGTIFKAAMIDFIEELPYVDYIKMIGLHHNGSSKDMITAGSPASILMAADNHTISGLLNNSINQPIPSENLACC